MEDQKFPSETEKLQTRGISKQRIINSKIRSGQTMTHEQQNTEKENHTIEKLAHKLKLESYDVNKYFRMKNRKW